MRKVNFILKGDSMPRYSDRQNRLVEELTNYVMEQFRDKHPEAGIPSRVIGSFIGDGDEPDAVSIINRVMENVRTEFPNTHLNKNGLEGQGEFINRRPNTTNLFHKTPDLRWTPIGDSGGPGILGIIFTMLLRAIPVAIFGCLPISICAYFISGAFKFVVEGLVNGLFTLIYGHL